jgi:enamine deaminase RidA (YjgF/YER057c/UK114 family)
MKTEYLNPKDVFDPGFMFTHTVAVSGATRLVYVSGQVSYDAKGAVVGKDDIRAQSEQVFTSLNHNLKAAGADWRDVIKINGYMVRMNPEAVKAYRQVRTRYLDPTRLPASTLVGVDRLVHPDLLLEVEVIAALGAKPVTAKKKKR